MADRGTAHAHRRRSSGFLTPAMVVALGIIAAGACAISLHVTQRAPIVVPDSAAYLSAAHNLVSGHGLTTAFNPATSVYHPAQAAAVYGRVPLAQYGPLYPAALALGHYVGLSANGSVRLVGLVTLVAVVVALGMLAMRLLDGLVPVASLVVLVCLAAPGMTLFGRWVNPLGLSTFALSDLLFSALMLATLLAVDAWLRNPTGGRWGVVGLLITAAILTRYAGVSLAAAAAGAALAEVGWDRRRRVLGALGMVGIGLAAFLGWDLVNEVALGAASPRNLVFHPSGHLIHSMLDVAGPWFFPTSWPSGFTSWGAAVIVVVAVVVALWSPARRWAVPLSPVTSRAPVRLWRIGGAFVIGYTVMLVVTRTWLDASLAIDNRVLGPIQTVVYLLIASLIYWSVRARVHAVRPRRWAIGAVVVAALAVWAPNLASLSSGLRFVAAPPPVEPAVRAIPPSQFVVTSDAARLYLADGHASMLLPFRRFYTTNQANPDFARDLGDVDALVRRHHGVVVWWPTLAPSVPSQEDLKQAGLVVAARLPGGALLLRAGGRG